MSALKFVARPLATVAVAVLVLLGVGCQTGFEPDSPGGTGAATATDTTEMGRLDEIRVGDKLSVALLGIPNPPQPQPMQRQVGDDGKIRLWMEVELDAAGKRRTELEENIRNAYVPRFFTTNTLLTVRVELEERYLWVGGAVRKSDRYLYTGGMTVMKAVRMAGDFTEFAHRTRIRVTRADGSTFMVNRKKAEKDAAFDPAVYPGDHIYVEKKPIFP